MASAIDRPFEPQAVAGHVPLAQAVDDHGTMGALHVPAILELRPDVDDGDQQPSDGAQL